MKNAVITKNLNSGASKMIKKDNTLINASYTLSLTEQRILMLSIAKAQKTNTEINHNDYLTIHANEFVESFDVDKKTVYRDLKTACDTLFKREFSYKRGSTVIRSHWLQSSKYSEDNGKIEILFAKELIPFISQLQSRFTKYFLNDTSKMTSVYAIRLYELIISWRSTHKTPIYELDELRNKVGVEPSEYPRMYDFKKRVLDVAVNQINSLSNIVVEVEQHKHGRKIVGFSFSFIEIKAEIERDPNTTDWINGEPDKPKRKKITEYEAGQLARPGEEWQELLQRIGKDYQVIFDKKD